MTNNIFGRNDFSVGSDVTVTLRELTTGQSWTADQLGHATDMSIEFDDKEETVEPFTGGGKVINKTVPKGFSGHMAFVRLDSTLEKLLIDSRAGWFNDGMSYVFDLQIQIRQRGGMTVHTYLLKMCSFSKGKLLTVKGTAPIDQGFSLRGQDVTITTA